MEMLQVEELKRQLFASQQEVEELINVKLIAELQQQKQDFEVYIKLLGPSKSWNKGTNTSVSVHIFILLLQGGIAQLQQEKEEILKEVGLELVEDKDSQVMVPMNEMKVLVLNKLIFQ
jgi:hypothetical protein